VILHAIHAQIHQINHAQVAKQMVHTQFTLRNFKYVHNHAEIVFFKSIRYVCRVIKHVILV